MQLTEGGKNNTIGAGKKSTIFFPNLDGLRFIAFFAVFFHHTLIVRCFSADPSSRVYAFFSNLKEAGALGVNLFFVLSGFLITYLLISEKNKFGTIHVPQFYLRRILRIWPLYYLVVIIGFIAFPLLKTMFGEVPAETHSPLYYVFFINNFQMITKGFADSSLLNVLWSVGVEEQFYLVWPVILLVIPKKYLLPAFGMMIVGSIYFRYTHTSVARVNYFHTLAVISDMVVGGVAAYFSFYSKRFLTYIKQLPKSRVVVVYVLMTLVILFRYIIFRAEAVNFSERFILSLFFAFVILEQNFTEASFYKLSHFPLLTKWGNYTYGLYCLHSLGLLVAHVVSEKIMKLHNPWAIMGIDYTLGMFLTLVMAYISYTYFERPFLKLKEKFAYITR